MGGTGAGNAKRHGVRPIGVRRGGIQIIFPVFHRGLFSSSNELFDRLGALDAALARLGRTLAGLSDPFRLPRARREVLDARLDDAVELLADVAVITDPVLPMPDGNAS